MMAKVRFAEKAKSGLRGKTTSKVKPKGKAKPARKVKPAPKKKPVAKAKVAAKPKAVAKPKTKPAVKLAVAEKPKLQTGQTILSIVLAQLEDAKAEDIISISLDGKTAIADNMVVASGRSNRHVGAIADQVVDKLKAAGHRNIRVEGMDQCDWVLVDAVDVIIHLFRPEVRSFYNLEKLWSEHSPQEPTAA